MIILLMMMKNAKSRTYHLKVRCFPVWLTFPMLMSTCTDAEFWIESDLELDEDLTLEGATITPTLPDEPLQESAEYNSIIRWVVTLLAVFQSRFYLTNRAFSWLLTFLFVILRFLGRYSTKVAELSLHFPHTLHQYQLFLSDIVPNISFEKRAVCVKCDAIYRFEESVQKIGTRTASVLCRNKLYKKRCNQTLMKQVILERSGSIPCYVSLISSLQTLVMRRGFVESTRGKFSPSGLSDVYDGSIWNDFLTVNGVPFLTECHNYGILLNVDWLQPYKHTEYSVGVIYLVILNLPRSIRYKREIVILYGDIPGPCKPSLTINSYLLPLVTELNGLWVGVQMKYAGSDSTVTFGCALLGVACDLPAARKCCGFLSYSANLGCSRCFQSFSRGLVIGIIMQISTEIGGSYALMPVIVQML